MKLFLRRMGRRHSTNGVGPLLNVNPVLADQDYVPGGSISGRYLTAPEMRVNGMGQASFAPDSRTGNYIRGMSVRSEDSSAPILGAMERQVSMPDGCLLPPPYTAPSAAATGCVVGYESLRKQSVPKLQAGQMQAPYVTFQAKSVSLPPRAEEPESREGIYEGDDLSGMCSIERLKEGFVGAQAAASATNTTNYYTNREFGPRTSRVDGMSAPGGASVDADPLEDLCAGTGGGVRGSVLAASAGFGGGLSFGVGPPSFGNPAVAGLPPITSTTSSFSAELAMPSVRLSALQPRNPTAGGPSALWCEEEPDLREGSANAAMAGNQGQLPLSSSYDTQRMRVELQENDHIYYGLAAERVHK